MTGGALWLVIGLLAVVGLEVTFRSSRSRSMSWLLLRWSLLGVALAVAVRLGPAVTERLARLTAVQPASPVSFEDRGDPLGLRALATQTPAYPFDGASVESMAMWRAFVLQQLRSPAHLDLPVGDTRGQPSVEVLNREDTGATRRTLLRFTSWDGTRVPAYVHEPRSGSAKGAVLVIPGHGRGIDATAGNTEDYQHKAAHALASRGYITLTPELRGFGALTQAGAPSHRLVAAAALAAGTSYKAIEVRDLQRALDVLAGWQGVDVTRIAAVGTSLGGELAVLLGSIDERVRVVVSNSYGGAHGPYREESDLTDESGPTPHGCHTMPGINRLLLQEDWFRLVAPRPVLVVRGDRDVSSQMPKFRALVEEAYSAPEARDRFSVAIEPGDHEFYLEPTVRFLDAWLRLSTAEDGSAR